MVQGARGEPLGVSRFDGTKSFHTLKLSLEDYEKNAQSIAGVSHLAMRNWEPHFVIEDGAVEPVVEPEIPVVPMAGIPVAKEPEHPKVDAKPMPEPRHPDTFSAPPPSYEPAKSDLDVPYFSLKKIAKNEGVDISEAEGTDHIKALIRKKREEKLQPA